MLDTRLMMHKNVTTLEVKPLMKAAIELLANYLAAQDDVLLAYLFGSRADDRAAPDSDYDVAVLLRRSTDAARQHRLAGEMSMVLDGADVDVVLLDRAPIELAFAVVATGRRLFERDVATRVEFEANVLSRYSDDVRMLREQRRELAFGAQDAARIRRYRAALSKTERVLAEIRATSQ
jgi:predicted nucleotidyltransferase